MPNINVPIVTLRVVSEMLNTLIWPITVLVILLIFRRTIRKFLNSIVEGKVKGPGFEISATRELKAAASLTAATVKTDPTVETDERLIEEDRTTEIVGLVSEAFNPKLVDRFEDARVLWVDDNPSNNYYERSALEALGLVFIVSKSTEDALKEIRKRKFDVIISDMGRPPDNRAGYTLLRKIRSENVDTPFIIYSIGADIPDHVAEARDKGAFGSTSDPRKLFRLVVKAITTAR